jgi:hypothetical protein
MAQEMVWLGGQLPYQQATEVFKRIGHRWIPSASVWRQTAYHGQIMERHMLEQQAQVGLERVRLPGVYQDHHQRKGVGIDGGMVHIRHEGWKEMKIGAVFDIETRLERDSHSRE